MLSAGALELQERAQDKEERSRLLAAKQRRPSARSYLDWEAGPDAVSDTSSSEGMSPYRTSVSGARVACGYLDWDAGPMPSLTAPAATACLCTGLLCQALGIGKAIISLLTVHNPSPGLKHHGILGAG